MKPLSFSFRFVRSVLVILTLAALGLAAVCAQAGSPHIVIAEIYGGGGNTGAPYKYDYIVLYNRSSAELSINGWSVQYASQAGSTWSVTPINGSIPAGGYYLVQEGSGGSVGANLPTPVNATGSINMSATVGKVALVNSTTALSGACPTGGNSIDFVGFGSGTACYEGSGPTPTPGNPTSVKRGGNGSTDNDNNAADFATGSPTPRNSATTPIIYGGPATQVRVETKADATGVVQPATNINSGISITNYAVARDANGLFAGNIFVAWLLVNVSGGVVAGDLVPAGDGKSATFTGHAPGSANINATWGPLTSVDSGLVTVESSAPPSGVGAANPSLVPAGQPTLLTVSVTPGNPPSPIVSVTGDLTAIGGVMGQSFYNDATHGDALAGDNIFSLSTIVATGTSSGLKTLPVTITDALSRPGSTTISLTVTNAPGIATQPQSRTNSAGDNAYFYVTATNGPQSYQWRLSGTNIPGATSSSYTRTNVGAADVGPYTVVVGNTYGSTTSAVAMLTVIGANSYKLAQWNFNNTTAPSVGSGTASLIGGTTASFAGGSTSNPSSSNAGWNTTTYPTQGTANKTAGAQFAVSTLGYVDVVVAWEEQHSSTASRYTRFQYTTDGLTYIDGPVSTITNASTFIYRTVDLSSIPGVADNTNFAFRIVSEHENTAITNTNPNYVATTSGSTYGPSGTIRFDGVTLFADPLPIQFVSQSAVKQTVGEGLPLNLSVTVSGGGPFTYQWYSNGVALVGATNSNLAFSAAALADTAKYRVMVGSPFTNNYPSDLFVVTVVEKNFFPTKLLPPPNGMYVNPYGRHVYCSANGVIISNIVHRLFGASVLPPEPGPPLSHNFGSVLEMEVSIDGGVNFQQVIATVNVGVGAQNAGSIGDEEEYATEMQGLTIISGPPNLQIRESPTLASSGRTDIKPIPGGYMINSFFDIYLEVSTDGGLTWCVGDEVAHMELRPDPQLITPTAAPRTVLPMPNGQYVSPDQWHQLYASGIIIKDIRHKLFTGWDEPPPFGTTHSHTFDSQLDFQLSTDGGLTFTPARAPAAMTVGIKNVRGFLGRSTYETEVTELTVAGGDLPANVMIRESPTKASRGGTSSMAGGGGGGAGGGAAISSFFDIFTEVSMDGGTNWMGATNGPAHMELQRIAPVHTFTNNLLPPLDGQYVSPQQWHAYYANGIVITNVIHRFFTAAITPPMPGFIISHTFGSTVEFDVSYDGGQSYSHATAPATVGVQIIGRLGDDGVTKYYDTEMTELAISGGGLPSYVQIRESPTKASLGRTTMSASGTGTDNDCDSFFDIFTEVSTDGGQSWMPAVSSPATVTLQPLAGTTLGITCPPNITVRATSPAGAVVNYPAPTVTGGMAPIAINCVPVSGSTFPIGTWSVNCTAQDARGQAASCSFNVTVLRQIQKRFFPQKLLPPVNGLYVPPATSVITYPGGIIISNITHRVFSTGAVPPETLGGSVTHSFSSQVEMDVSFNGGLNWQSCVVPNAPTEIYAIHNGVDGADTVYGGQALQLHLSGGTLPAGVQIRESPTLASAGETRIETTAGGYLIDSFFDIYTEVSTDYGGSWLPASAPLRVELKPDPQLVQPTAAPRTVLPMPNGQYISPTAWHQLYAAGIVIKDIRHKLFTGWMAPPVFGASQTHTFDSQLDFQLSTDGGVHFSAARAPATMTVTIGNARVFQGRSTYDTEVTQLDVAGGDLPAGVMIRESPTKASKGGTSSMAGGGGGGAGGGAAISSFFDIFTEVSTDSGATWGAATNGPAHMELERIAAVHTFPNNLLPVLSGEYISPQQWHAYYANGIVITNVIHRSFTAAITPPLPGISTSHTFGSTLEFDVSYDGGLTYSHATAPATVGVQITGRLGDDGVTVYYDTEMTQLSVAGGGLPANVQIRESPTKASLGRTTSSSVPGGGYQVDSFFDIFTEVSTDNGLSWLPSIAGPATVTLRPHALTPLVITCPSNITVRATSPAGAVVYYTVTASGGCPPYTFSCAPPSGSTFPIGKRTVNCVVTDGCGGQASCSFQVTVLRQLQKRFYPQNLLPPVNGLFAPPATTVLTYPGNILISNITHRVFSAGVVPPTSLGTSVTHGFTSTVEFDISFDGGLTWQSQVVPNAPTQIYAVNNGVEGVDTVYGGQALQLSLSGGTLPAGVMIRESPTLASAGETRIESIAGGYLIDSFFDIYTEVSTDSGATWVPASQALRVEAKPDPQLIAATAAPRNVLPMPNGQYISPTAWHQLYAAGIVIKDIRHKLFTGWMAPPVFSGSQTHTFDSQLDFQLSTDGGSHFTAARAPATMTVTIGNVRGFQGRSTYETEVTQLDVAGGDLPAGVLIRESPTKASKGGTSSMAGGGGGGAGGGAAISSFFDIFTEVSTDGGVTWGAATNGPAHMELQRIAAVHTFTNNLLPALAGEYVSPQQWHAYYAVGLVITNVVHRSFTAAITPPLPGISTSHTFGSTLEFDVSYDGGLTYSHTTAPATVGVQITGRLGDDGTTVYYDTEMTELSVAGGGLPSNIQIRESPTKASLGRTTTSSVVGGGYQTDSFFDIFTEVSTDNGLSWLPSIAGPATVTLRPHAITPLVITCPSNITVRATSAAGAVVYYTVTASGGCPPYTFTCVPPSGSTFPIGTRTVNCMATDGCGQQASCSFTVTVLRQIQKRFYPQNLLPPVNGLFAPPATTVLTYPGNILISNITHRVFSAGVVPPTSLGTSITHGFTSTVEFDISFDGGLTWQSSVVTNAPTQIYAIHNGVDGADTVYGGQALQLSLSGGTLPAGVMIRESPTLASAGETRIETIAGGYLIDSFFDIFTEVSTDSGSTWVPANQALRVELRPDPQLVEPTAAPRTVLPMPNGQYISPSAWHQLYAAGIVIKDIRHKLFTGWMAPPVFGASQTHTFDSQLDFQLSTDGGNHFTAARAPATMTVTIGNARVFQGRSTYETEVTQLDVAGGDLPVGLMIRESPTKASKGGTSSMAGGGGGGAGGGAAISSFFDIFTEVSTDGGATWGAATNGPAHMELERIASAFTFTNNLLPVLSGEYISPQQWHAYYANGIVITNVIHRSFTAAITPPLPGISTSHTFGSTLEFDVSYDGGLTYSHATAPATVGVQITGRLGDDGVTVYYDTEMTQLSVAGGGLPANVQIRESPTKASLGRTTTSSVVGGGYQTDSFFDIFTEVSTDGGATWMPSIAGPATVTLQLPRQVTGQIELEGYLGPAHNGSGTRLVTFSATDSSGTVVLKQWNLPLNFTAGQSGYGVAGYILTGVPEGTAHISAKTAWNLRQRQNVTFFNGQAQANFLLPGGDIDDSNLIDIWDYFRLASVWYEQDAGADIDGDGLVGSEDYFLLASHWYQLGDPQ